MFELKIVSHFSAAHQLREFHGECEKLHGHNWKIEVYVIGDALQENGLLMDFRVIKNETKRILDGLDHKFLNELEKFKTTNPSSENIAHHIFMTLSGVLNKEGVRVSKVTAWESENACASYMEP
jgi:6-pyruvoyltetrahydropterin/6-carboxytetrahydropterin synthase